MKKSKTFCKLPSVMVVLTTGVILLAATEDALARNNRGDGARSTPPPAAAPGHIVRDHRQGNTGVQARQQARTQGNQGGNGGIGSRVERGASRVGRGAYKSLWLGGGVPGFLLGW
jgi:hypothetical protein